MKRLLTLGVLSIIGIALWPSSQNEIARKRVLDIVMASECSKYRWKDRGRVNLSYFNGMGIMYYNLIKSKNATYRIAGTMERGKIERDFLMHYGIRTGSEAETFRMVYAGLIGLGVRESSGRYCCGRDMSANYSTADSAEAGLFQASYGSRRVSKYLDELYSIYKSAKRECLLDIFSKNVICSAVNAINWGNGEGVNWQKLTKECPAFAVEWTLVLMRQLGGSKGEFGPIRRKEVEVLPACVKMLEDIEKV